MTNLLVLDKESYKINHSRYLSLMNDLLFGNNQIIYTSYEDKRIRKVRNIKIIGSFLQHILYWKKSYDYAKRIYKTGAVTIYCLNPIVGVFLGLLNARKSRRIVLCGFLFEPKKSTLYYKLRQWVTYKAIKNIDTIVVYGSSEVEYYSNIFPNIKFVFMKYGIDFNVSNKYEGIKLPENYLFSGGGSNRDYLTLTEAYNRYIECGGNEELVIATQPWRLRDCKLSNITVIKDVVNETFGDVLKKSMCLLLSLKETDISAGHMVMFQAMSLKIPVIVNDIPAIRDYVDESQVLFYMSGDVDALCRIMKDFSGENIDVRKRTENAYILYNTQLCFDEFIKRVLSI